MVDMLYVESAYKYLVDCALRGQITTYAELYGNAFGTLLEEKTEGREDGFEMAQDASNAILRQLTEWCIATNQPILTSLIISASDGVPAKKFWECLPGIDAERLDNATKKHLTGMLHTQCFERYTPIGSGNPALRREAEAKSLAIYGSGEEALVREFDAYITTFQLSDGHRITPPPRVMCRLLGWMNQHVTFEQVETHRPVVTITLDEDDPDQATTVKALLGSAAQAYSNTPASSSAKVQLKPAYKVVDYDRNKIIDTETLYTVKRVVQLPADGSPKDVVGLGFADLGDRAVLAQIRAAEVVGILNEHGCSVGGNLATRYAKTTSLGLNQVGQGWVYNIINEDTKQQLGELYLDPQRGQAKAAFYPELKAQSLLVQITMFAPPLHTQTVA